MITDFKDFSRPIQAIKLVRFIADYEALRKEHPYFAIEIDRMLYNIAAQYDKPQMDFTAYHSDQNERFGTK